MNVHASAFIHEKAIVESGARVGARTRVWAFAHVLAGAVIGDECNICDHVFIENDVLIGSRVTVKCGVYVWDGARVDDLVFLGPNVAFTNDVMPRSKRHQQSFPRLQIQRGVSVGANATILPGITIGQWAMIGASCVVVSDVPDFALMVGNPMRQIGHVCICATRLVVPADADYVSCSCGRAYEWDGSRLHIIGTDDPDW